MQERRVCLFQILEAMGGHWRVVSGRVACSELPFVRNTQAVVCGHRRPLGGHFSPFPKSW